MSTKAEDLSGCTVLLAVDGSPQAEHAFTWYMENLHRPKNEVVLVHGSEVPALPTRESWEAQAKAGEEKSKSIRDKYTALAESHAITPRFVTDIEKPGELICKIARQEKVTYVVMGTRGLGKIRRTIMGSVSDYVVHHAHCPVLVCRQ